jgi:hypothetical protein
MQIFIRTTGDRSIEQFGNLDYKVLMDKERTGCRGYFKQLQQLKSIDDDILLLEDDIKLRKNFFECLNSLIEMTNNRYIINMSQPTGGIKLCNPADFMWTRAVYYPKGSISSFMKNYSDDSLEVSQYYDKIQATLMTDKYVGCPSAMTIIDLNLKPIMTYEKGKN